MSSTVCSPRHSTRCLFTPKVFRGSLLSHLDVHLLDLQTVSLWSCPFVCRALVLICRHNSSGAWAAFLQGTVELWGSQSRQGRRGRRREAPSRRSVALREGVLAGVPLQLRLEPRKESVVWLQRELRGVLARQRPRALLHPIPDWPAQDILW